MTDFTSVCQRLDNLVLNYFQTLDEILCHNKQLATAMQTGFLCMAKARYSMGNKSVSSVQYDHEDMEANIKVNTTDDDNCQNFLISWQDRELPRETDDSSVQDTSLRKRNVAKTGTKAEIEEQNLEEQSEGIKNLKISEKSTKKHKDPLKWFGVLVPQALRQSQSSFQGAVELTIQLTALKAKLLALKQKYRETMKLKKKLQKETEILKSEDFKDYEVIAAEDKQAEETPNSEDEETLKSEDEEKQDSVKESESEVENISAKATEFETSL